MVAVSRYKCPGCSASMEFDPQTAGLKCSYCGKQQKIEYPVSTEVRELPFDEYAGGRQQRGGFSDKALEVSCTTCGATVEFEPPEVAGACPFCSAAIVMQPKGADPLIAPNGVLPFAMPKDRATGAIREWLSSRWFAPSALKNLARPEGIHGVYVPFWTYDASCHSRYRGQRGDYYYETQYVTVRNNAGQMERREQRVRHTRWSSASGAVNNSFDDVLIPASRAIDEGRLRELAPWDLESVKPYEPAYLSGFKAQRYQVSLDDGLASARTIMEQSIHASCLRDIGGDEQRVDDIDTRYSNVTFKHVLLPVWIGAYRFQSNVFQVTVNARTGEVQGERPYSALKIAIFVIAVLIVLVIVAMIAQQSQ